jgi:hypothetical protein
LECNKNVSLRLCGLGLVQYTLVPKEAMSEFSEACLKIALKVLFNVEE